MYISKLKDMSFCLDAKVTDYSTLERSSGFRIGYREPLAITLGQ